MSRDGRLTRAETLLARNESTEALEWLRGETNKSQRALAEFDNLESQKVIERIYELGAKRVSACEFVTNPPYEAIVWLVLELPEARWRREEVFEHISNLTGMDSTPDTSQRFLAVWFD